MNFVNTISHLRVFMPSRCQFNRKISLINQQILYNRVKFRPIR